MVGEILIFTDKGYKNIPDLLSYASSNECCLTYRRARFLSQKTHVTKREEDNRRLR
jgi:hypothetical protein